jgi:hypothetical protein
MYHQGQEPDADLGAKVYDLYGRRIQQTGKGLRIIGGKKVIVR